MVFDNDKKNDRKETSRVLKAYFEHRTSLERYLRRFLNNFQDVEDVAQEAFLRAYSEEQSTEISQPKSFLFRVAKHVAISNLRLKSRQITDYIADSELQDVIISDSLEDEVLAQQKLGIHCEAVATLPPKCRRVYLLRKVYGMTHKEIAEHMGISVSTVEKHLIKGISMCDKYVRSVEDGQGEISRSGTASFQKVTTGEKS